MGGCESQRMSKVERGSVVLGYRWPYPAEDFTEIAPYANHRRTESQVGLRGRGC